jgi:DNA primase
MHFVKNSPIEIRDLVINLIHDRYEVSQHWFERHRIHIPTESEPDVLVKIGEIVLLRYQHIRARMMIEENLSRLKEAQTSAEEEEVQQIHQELKMIEKEIARKLGNVILK